MAGTLIVADGTCWLPAGWVYDAALERIADELTETDPALAADLLTARTIVGSGFCDLRPLEGTQFRRVLRAVNRAYEQVRAAGPIGFHDPSFFPGFRERFGELAALVRADPRSTETFPSARHAVATADPPS